MAKQTGKYIFMAWTITLSPGIIDNYMIIGNDSRDVKIHVLFKGKLYMYRLRDLKLVPEKRSPKLRPDWIQKNFQAYVEKHWRKG